MIRFIPLFALAIWLGKANGQVQLLPTDGKEIELTPILHATMVLEWNDHTIYVDPYGGADRFSGFESADLVLITHVHGDHLNKETLDGLDLSDTELIAPQSVIDQLGDHSFGSVTAIGNGEIIDRLKMSIKAVPMYNLPETADSRHPKGKGNGYVMTIGGKNIYISGDTEDIAEMRALQNIDYAFICMNLPYTMDIDAAASAVIEFKPKVMFPFHYRGGGGVYSDVVGFKELVQAGAPEVEVRILNWYPE